jgi:hypothetical protein
MCGDDDEVAGNELPVLRERQPYQLATFSCIDN